MADRTTENLLARYEGNRVVRGLVQLIPFGIGGALDVVITKTLSNIREERSRAFFDELTKTSRQLEPTVLESEDFLHCYFATVRYALNSRRREKIQMFARLLKASLGETGPRDVDEYEEFLEILDDLTFRELQALAIMDSFSVRPRTPEQNNLQWTNTFWDEFEDRIVRELRVPKDEVSDFLNRISRTACYEIFTGGYMDYTGGKGKLTPTYRRLKRFISSEAENAA
jgi:CRISPR/Cas system CSM-associated protein Csm2 small subunit